MTQFRYKAFASYSWADAAWGKWLLHALETYRIPAALIGKDGALGPVAARLIPLFKDREEEAAGASIGKAVEAALSTSEFLIVICSPNSAASKWVNHEIAWFKTHRDPEWILALIVDGEPGSGAETFALLTRCKFGPNGSPHDVMGAHAYRTLLLFPKAYPALRADPRFVAVCTRMGLVEYWLESGNWPDCAGEVPYDFKAECEGLRGHPKDAFLT